MMISRASRRSHCHALPAPLPPTASPRRGAAAVEFAVVAPFFFLVVLGLVELGRGLMVQHQLTNAARQGCRAAIIEGKTTNDASTTVSNLLAGLGISGATTNVLVNEQQADASTAVAGDEITVKVSVPAGSVSWVPGANFLFGTITGQSTLRRE
jgi:Flp pilus assembly protein TadG